MIRGGSGRGWRPAPRAYPVAFGSSETVSSEIRPKHFRNGHGSVVVLIMLEGPRARHPEPRTDAGRPRLEIVRHRRAEAGVARGEELPAIRNAKAFEDRL